MSDLVFPTLPGMDTKVEREEVYAAVVHTASSGKEQRGRFQTTPRYRYTLTFSLLRDSVAAPSPHQALSETAVVKSFFDQHYGQWDSFLFNDPIDSVQRRVRFASDSLTYEQLADGVFAIKKLQLITVK